MRFVKWGVVGLAVALAGMVAAVREASATAEKSLKDQPAPEIEFGDWLNTPGKKALSEFHGQVVLIEFWSTG